MHYLIGIDGGGTKTQVVLADHEGNVISNERYGSTNPNTVTKQDLVGTFHDIFQDIQEKVTPEQIHSVFAGVSGAGSEKSALLLQGIIAQNCLEKTMIRVEPDSLNALYSGTFGGSGIVHISGTGSITFGINQEKQQERVGGWGYLLGDEGSGYDIGRQGLIAALQFVDGRGPHTVLMDLLFGYFKVMSGRELIDKIYQNPDPRLAISQVSTIVFKAFAANDTVAAGIMESAANEISHSIKTLDQKLFPVNEPVDIILCGGLFSNRTVLPVRIQEYFSGYQKKVTFILPEVPPVAGSLIGAFLLMEEKVKPVVINNIRKYWKDDIIQ